MNGSRLRYQRRLAAWLCLLALAASAVALPAMHAAVHLAEHLADRPAPRPRVVVHRYQHCHGGTCHVDEDGSKPGPRAPHHRHDGDRDGEHGRGSPEHAAALILTAVAPALPPRALPVAAVAYTVRSRSITIAAIHGHEIRGPPRAQT